MTQRKYGKRGLELFIITVVPALSVPLIMKTGFISRRPKPVTKPYRFLGRQMNYRVLGNGAPIVLVHGSMTSDPWGGFEERLARHNRVYLPDLPGFGGSEAIPGQRHDTALFSRALSAFLEEAHLTETPVMALSLGTIVAVKAAVSGHLRGDMILIGMPGRVMSNVLKWALRIPVPVRRIIAATRLGRQKILIPVLWDIIGVSGDSDTKEMMSLLESSDVRALVDQDPVREIEFALPDLLPQVRNRTTFIYGSEDPLIHSTQDLVSHPVIVKGAGHNVCTSAPDRLLTIIQQTID